MHKTYYILIFIFFGSITAVAQKTIQKQYSSAEIVKLSIEDDAIFKITVRSSKEKYITLSVHISGENSENIIIAENLSKGKLSLKTEFSPFFKPKNDKLAAHKVIAVEVDLIIPQSVSLEIKSKLASVTTHGLISNLEVSIDKGNCILKDFLGNAHLKTTDGNIVVKALPSVSGKAITISGTAENNLKAGGKFFIEAESINGNISLQQTE